MKDRFELKEHASENYKWRCEPDIIDTENDVLYNSQFDLDLICERLNEQNRQISILLKALDLACDDLSYVKDMLYTMGSYDFANSLDDSSDYFRTKAKYLLEERK